MTRVFHPSLTTARVKIPTVHVVGSSDTMEVFEQAKLCRDLCDPRMTDMVMYSAAHDVPRKPKEVQLQLPLPNVTRSTVSVLAKEPILIYGGSTATGTLAIQFAKLYEWTPFKQSEVNKSNKSGYTVITTCSPHNFPLVRDRGADHILDCRSPTLTEDIRSLTDNKLRLVLDCITISGSIARCCGALAPPSADCDIRYCGLFTVGDLPRSDVKAGFTLAYTALGESFQKWDNYYPGSPKNARFTGDFMKLTSALLDAKMIQSHPAEVQYGGLTDVLQGLDCLRKGGVSGVKLVYTL